MAGTLLGSDRAQPLCVYVDTCVCAAVCLLVGTRLDMCADACMWYVNNAWTRAFSLLVLSWGHAADLRFVSKR